LAGTNGFRPSFAAGKRYHMTPARRIAATSLICVVGGIAAVLGHRTIAADAALAPAPPRPIALVGALIRTQTDVGDFVGTVVIDDGKIAAIGPTISVPTDAIRIDLSRHVITPGLIDARSVLWMNPSAARESGSTGNLNILDGVDPFAEDWRDAARQGVTAVYVQPASGGRFGGNGAVLRVGPARSADDLVVRSPAGVQATLGVPTAPQASPQNEQLAQLAARLGIPFPQQQEQAAPASNSLTRYTQYEAFRGLFDAAKRYGESKPTERDASKELLLLALKRGIPVRLETAHEDDLRNLVKLTADFGLRTIFERLDKVKTLPEELAGRKDPLIVGPFVGGKKSADVRRLALDGRRFAIGTYGDLPQATAWLRVHAAAAVADGYPRDRVLRALTRDAAELHGVGDKLGSLAPGRVADLVVFAGDPLDPSAPVRMTISQGTVTFDAPSTEVAPAITESKPTLPDALPTTFVLRTTRLLNDAGEFVPGELNIAGGRISERTADAPVIDIGDAPVTPGLVAGRVSIGGESFPDADAGNLRGTDGVPWDHTTLRSFRDAGFMSAIVAPGSANVIAGLASAVRTAEPGAASDAGLFFVLTADARNIERYPASLIGQIELIGDRLRGLPSQSQLYLPESVSKAVLTQREHNLGAVRSGRSTAYFEAHSRAEIRAALRLIAEFKLRGVIVQPKQFHDMADEIRAAGVGVVVGPARPQDTDKVRTGLAELGKAGLPLMFSGGDAADIRNTAAWLVNAGMPRPAARRGLVGQAPERLGLPQGTGRLSAGDGADFVIWDGDPLDPGARPVAVIVHGQRVGRGS
jgi:imidazolonepropionase-like amidohydrolase